MQFILPGIRHFVKLFLLITGPALLHFLLQPLLTLLLLLIFLIILIITSIVLLHLLSSSKGMALTRCLSLQRSTLAFYNQSTWRKDDLVWKHTFKLFC